MFFEIRTDFNVGFIKKGQSPAPPYLARQLFRNPRILRAVAHKHKTFSPSRACHRYS